MRKILIESDDGKVTVDMQGFKGKACIKEASKMDKMLRELGIKVDLKSLTPKPEMEQEVAEHVGKEETAD
jgi:hypothetical protein